MLTVVTKPSTYVNRQMVNSRRLYCRRPIAEDKHCHYSLPIVGDYNMPLQRLYDSRIYEKQRTSVAQEVNILFLIYAIFLQLIESKLCSLNPFEFFTIDSDFSTIDNVESRTESFWLMVCSADFCLSISEIYSISSFQKDLKILSRILYASFRRAKARTQSAFSTKMFKLL